MSKQAGFTLIELMIVVVVVGILTSIAVPAYTDHIVRGKIAQGVGALSEAKVRMEQVFNSERTYNCALISARSSTRHPSAWQSPTAPPPPSR
jgi:prepilin-type N-terminal cleavage/methylation domain-containing protein